MSNDKYIHSEVETKIYSYWEKHKLFEPKKNEKTFSIVIPPPNVTGSLHMGHALNNSIQDLLIRFHRMNNYETCLLYTSPSPRDRQKSRMPSSA